MPAPKVSFSTALKVTWKRSEQLPKWSPRSLHLLNTCCIPRIALRTNIKPNSHSSTTRQTPMPLPCYAWWNGDTERLCPFLYIADWRHSRAWIWSWALVLAMTLTLLIWKKIGTVFKRICAWKCNEPKPNRTTECSSAGESGPKCTIHSVPTTGGNPASLYSIPSWRESHRLHYSCCVWEYYW